MEEKCKCIICGEIKESTEEHIIPKSLGNNELKISCVCKECNSGLGANVDNYLVNHRFVQIIRQNLKLKGQSGQIPNPFKEGKDKEGNIIHVDNLFVPSVVPKVEQQGNRLRVSAPTYEQAVELYNS